MAPTTPRIFTLTFAHFHYHSLLALHLKMARNLALVTLTLSSIVMAFPLSDSSQIIGGTEASIGQFPSIVSLATVEGGHFCGGTLLNSNTVISAAHCAEAWDGVNLSSIQVRVDSLVRSLLLL